MPHLVLALLLAMPVHVAANCLLLADIALVARALSEDGIGEAQAARVMGRIYALSGAPADAIEKMAVAAAGVSVAPVVYARAVRMACESVKRGDKET